MGTKDSASENVHMIRQFLILLLKTILRAEAPFGFLWGCSLSGGSDVQCVLGFKILKIGG